MTTPTLVEIDGFNHQSLQTNQAGSGFAGIYDSITNAGAITFVTANKRTSAHVACLQVVEDGVTAANVSKTLASQTNVFSCYVRIPTATTPPLTSELFRWQGSVVRVQITTAGTVRIANVSTIGTGTTNICDGRWHLIDVYIDTSSTTFTAKVSIDGTEEINATLAGQVATPSTNFRIGTVNNTDNMTVQYQDCVWSTTLADYPIGHHIVLPLYPSGEGTDALGTTNKIQDEAGGFTNLYQKINDWSGGGAPDTAHYITYPNTATGDAASNFAEFTIGSPSGSSVVWDVEGFLAGFAAGTTTDNADLQVLTAHGGTLIDHIGNLIDYSGSTTVLGYFRQKLARPAGGWTTTNLAAIVLQWGRSTDTNPQPRLSAVMLEWAGPQSAKLIGATTTLTPARSMSTGKALALSATLAPARGASTINKALVLAATFTPVRGASTIAKTIAAAMTLTPARGATTIAKTVALAATLTPVLNRLTSRAFDLGITLDPAATKSTARAFDLAAILTPDAVKTVGKALDLAVTFDPAETKTTNKAIALAMTLTPDLSIFVGTIYTFLAELTTTFTPARGATTVNKALDLGVTFDPATQRTTMKVLSLDVTLSPVLSKIASAVQTVLWFRETPAITWTREVPVVTWFRETSAVVWERADDIVTWLREEAERIWRDDD